MNGRIPEIEFRMKNSLLDTSLDTPWRQLQERDQRHSRQRRNVAAMVTVNEMTADQSGRASSRN
jgi:hypothetical protein